MGFAYLNRWFANPAGVPRGPVPGSLLQTTITDILAAQAAIPKSQQIRPGGFGDVYQASGDYPIVPVGGGASANIDIAARLTMMDEVLNVLEAAKKRMRGISNLTMILKMKEPGQLARYEDLFLGIPLKQDVSQEGFKVRDWHVLLEETAAVLHIVGRRLYEEGEYALALSFFNRSLGHYFSLGAGVYEGWTQGVQANIRVLPASRTGERKTVPPFTLSDALTSYRREFMTGSGRYSFAPPPTTAVDDIFAPPDFRNTRGLQREIAGSQPSLPAMGVVRNVFEAEWAKLSRGRRFLLNRALHRLQVAQNQSAMEILSQMVWWLRKKGMHSSVIEKFIGKGIQVLDIFLNRSPQDLIAQIVIDDFPFTHPNFVRRKEEFIFFGTIDGVDIYYMDPNLS